MLGSDDFAPPQKQPFVMPQRHRRVAIPEDVREKMTNTVLNTIGAGVTAFTCLVCNRQFSRGSDLTRHYNSRGNDCSAVGSISDLSSVKPKESRKSYTFQKKRSVLMYFDELLRKGCYNPIQMVSHHLDLKCSTIRLWIRDRAKIFYLGGKSEYANRRKWRVKRGEHADAEHELFQRFVWRRVKQKRRVGYRWLKKNMRQILRDGEGLNGFTGSNQWARNFCLRWDITNQCRTNRKVKSIRDRLEQIRGFHQFLIYGLQRSKPERCPKYGRFPPNRMFHCDQVPLPFSPNCRKTLNLKKSQCAVADPVGDGGKRFATIHITICADPSQSPINIEVYFRGQGIGLSDEEMNFYKTLPSINVRFQEKAWADENICLQYI